MAKKPRRNLRVDTRVGDNPKTDRAADIKRIGNSVASEAETRIGTTRNTKNQTQHTSKVIKPNGQWQHGVFSCKILFCKGSWRQSWTKTKQHIIRYEWLSILWVVRDFNYWSAIQLCGNSSSSHGILVGLIGANLDMTLPAYK